jgi:hypothetical protein
MTASACLQILISPRRIAAHGDVRAAVARVTNAYLDAQWSWPRRYVEMSPTAYMLADPYAPAINSVDVERLSQGLQTRLFGQENSGDVEIAVFEGSQADAMRFAALSPNDVAEILDPESTETFGLNGRVTRVRTDGAELIKAMESEDETEPLIDAASVRTPSTRIMFRGVYLTAKQSFVASIASRWNVRDRSPQTILDGPGHYPLDQERFDLETIEALLAKFPDSGAAQGVIHLPLSYTNLCRRGVAARYSSYLSKLGEWDREMLVAQVYDVPRLPRHSALLEIGRMLAPQFGAIDLMITDPETEFVGLKPGLARSITLSLPNGDEVLRESAIRRFLSRKAEFRDAKVWPIVGNVRARREMQFCNSAGCLLMHGPGITGILDAPAAAGTFPLTSLPMTAECSGAPQAAMRHAAEDPEPQALEALTS